MAGTALTAFSSFAEATGPLYLSGPRHVIADAAKNTYSFGQLMSGNRGNKKTIQGGESIRESVKLNVTRRTRWHLPGDTHSWKNPQNLKKIQARFRYLITHMAWTKQEVLLNDKIKYGTSDAQFQQYVDLLYDKEGEMWMDKWNLLEESMWALPISADMESDDGVQMYSIPAFVNGFPDGKFVPGSDNGATWTTVEGINSTDTGMSNFTPTVDTYSATTTNSDNIISTFDSMWKELRFEAPPSHADYFTDPRYGKYCIFTSKVGHTAYQQLLREHTAEGFHNVTGSQDPAFPDPAYYGIPVKWVSELQTATLYPDAGNGVVSEGDAACEMQTTGATGIGPRFYWINSEFLHPVFHDEMYFEKDSVSRAHEDPDTYVMPVSTWCQMPCTSRKRQGYIEPSGDHYTALY